MSYSFSYFLLDRYLCHKSELQKYYYYSIIIIMINQFINHYCDVMYFNEYFHKLPFKR